MDYDIETETDGDYFHVRVEPAGNTAVGELAGRLERERYMPNLEGEINGYEAEAELTDDAIEITLDLTTGEESPQALVEATEQIHEYLEDTPLPDEFVDQFRGGPKKGMSHDYK